MKDLYHSRKQKHLIIQKADKGNTIVLTEKNSFIFSFFQLILDESKLEHVNHDEAKQLIPKSGKKVVNSITRLKNEGKISEKEYEKICHW